MAKILIVDDELIFRQTVGDILRMEGYEVNLVDHGEAALKELEQGSYDMMLLDFIMPGMDGLEVMKAAAQIAPDTKIILLTGHGTLESAIGALHSGAHDYLIKPASSSEILSSVARGLSRRVEQQQRRMLEQLDSSLHRLKEAEGVYSRQAVEQKTVVLDDGVMVDLARREIWRGNQRVSLTTTEGKLMKVLLDNRGRVLTHRELVLLVQGYETSEWEAPEVLRPLISRLRRKLSAFPNGERWIVNVRGTGYVFEWRGEKR
jgi:DNA-binding response OmpR family regulator